MCDGVIRVCNLCFRVLVWLGVVVMVVIRVRGVFMVGFFDGVELGWVILNC